MLALQVHSGKGLYVGTWRNGSSVAIDFVNKEAGGADSIEQRTWVGAGLGKAPWPEFSHDHRCRLRCQQLSHAREDRRFRTLSIDLDHIYSRHAALDGQRIQGHGLHGHLGPAARRIV